jgi:hypothetical protein
MTRRLALPFLAAVLLVGCESRDVAMDLRIIDGRTGWYDVGVQADGDNKVVPSVAFALENVSESDIASVQLNAVFRRVGDETTWGEHFVRGIDADGLAVGASTDSIVLRSTLGYTGPQTRDQMLLNQQFVDATVEIFGKHGRSMWTKMAEFQIERALLTEE